MYITTKTFNDDNNLIVISLKVVLNYRLNFKNLDLYQNAIERSRKYISRIDVNKKN